MLIRPYSSGKLAVVGHFGHSETAINNIFPQGCEKITEPGIWCQVIYEQNCDVLLVKVPDDWNSVKILHEFTDNIICAS